MQRAYYPTKVYRTAKKTDAIKECIKQNYKSGDYLPSAAKLEAQHGIASRETWARAIEQMFFSGEVIKGVMLV
jgi:DNA-binding GntR family transcriptional regulator